MTKRFLTKKWIFASILGILALILGFKFLSARNDFPEPYRFESLRNCSDEKMIWFMSGTKEESFLHEASAPENNFPKSLWNTDPKKAALAFAEANRSPTHRKNFQLWADSSTSLTAPNAGWLILNDFHEQTILRFGSDHPFLLHASTNSLGWIGNRYVDGEKRALQLIPLSHDEARFLVGIAFWIEHLKSMPTSKDYNHSSISVSDEGFGKIEWQIEKQAPYSIQGTLWDYPGISDRWRDNYNEEVQLNLIHFLFNQALPNYLEKRWEQPKKIDYDSYKLPLADRLNAEEDATTQAKLTQVVLTALTLHETDALPSAALIALAKCAGDMGLIEVLPALEALSEKHETSTQEHDSLTQAIRQLHALGKPEPLRELAQSKDDAAMWALHQLYRIQPDAYAEVLVHRFVTEDSRQRSEIFKTLAALNPTAARRLRDSLTDKEQTALLLEITEFERTDDPSRAQSRIPALLDIVGKPTEKVLAIGGYQPASKRGPTIEMLAKLPLSNADQQRFEKLLLKELTSPEILATYGESTIGYAATAIVALPNPDRYWDALYVAISTEASSQFDALLDALAALAISKQQPRLAQLAELLRPRLQNHESELNAVLLAALALDLRSLAPEIAQFATSNPVVPDRENTNSCEKKSDQPCLHRYHSARHISALWQESDPETRARMWAALLLNSPNDFRGKGTIPSSLRDRCRSAIAAVSPEVTGKIIAKIRANDGFPTEIKDWLDYL